VSLLPELEQIADFELSVDRYSTANFMRLKPPRRAGPTQRSTINCLRMPNPCSEVNTVALISRNALLDNALTIQQHDLFLRTTFVFRVFQDFLGTQIGILRNHMSRVGPPGIIRTHQQLQQEIYGSSCRDRN
jgi:hypothetical protein